MLDQILWFDALLKLIPGALLLLSPKLVASTFGLPRVENGFYARLLGATFVGLGLAIIVEGATGRAAGLGPGGAMAINITGGTVLLLLMFIGRNDLTLRGRILLWGVLAAMGLLSIGEFAFSG